MASGSLLMQTNYDTERDSEGYMPAVSRECRRCEVRFLVQKLVVMGGGRENSMEGRLVQVVMKGVEA